MPASEIELEEQAKKLVEILTEDSQELFIARTSFYYKNQIEEVAALQKKEQELEVKLKETEQTLASREKELTIDDMLNEQIDLINKEVQLYEETIKSLQSEISAIDEHLKSLDQGDIKQILLLKRNLSKLNENLKKYEKEAKDKKKQLEKTKEKKINLEALKNIEKKQKKQLAGSQNAEIDSFAVFLLPGKLLENYKKTLQERVKYLEKELQKTRANIQSLERDIKQDLQPQQVASKKQNAQSEPPLPTTPFQSSAQQSKREVTTQISSRVASLKTATSEQKSNLPKVLESLLKKINSRPNEVSKGVMTVSPTPTPSSPAQTQHPKTQNTSPGHGGPQLPSR